MAPTRRLLLLFLLNLALTATASSQGLDTTDYFPLHVGDSYVYYTTIPCPPSPAREREGPSKYSLVTDTVRIRGQKYFIRDRFFLSPDTLRRDSAGNILIRTSGEDGVFYKLHAAEGDTWSFPIRITGGVTYYTVTLQSRTDVVNVLAGQFTNCLRFYFDIPSMKDDEFSHWLAPNVGLVFHCDQEPKELYSARIGGVEYPRTVSVPIGDSYPIEHFFLYQNYPNPFNPETAIEYSIPTQGVVNIEVYNVLGQKVRTLISREEESGRHRVLWDAKDQSGRMVSSGLFFIRISSNGQTNTIRSVYLR